MDLKMGKVLKKIVNENIETINYLSGTYSLLGEENFNYIVSFFVKLYKKLNIDSNQGVYELNNNLGKKENYQLIFEKDKITFYFYFNSKMIDLYFYVYNQEKLSSDFISFFKQTFDNDKQIIVQNTNKNIHLGYKVDKYFNKILNWENICDDKNIEEFAEKINSIKEYVLNI